MKENGYSKMLIPSILSISLLTIMAPTAISPALAAIREAFPGITATEAKFVLTIPTLVMMPMGLLSARLSATLDKKRLLLVGMSLYLIFGVAGALVSHFGVLLVVRALFGVGLGIMTPLSTSLIFDFAPDVSRRSRLLGIQGASNQLGGLIFMSLSGILASLSWRYSFLTYGFVLVSLLLTAAYLPAIPPCKPSEVGRVDRRKRLSVKLFVLAFFAMMIFACYFVVNTDLALFMDAAQIGDAKRCGYALSLMRIPAIVAGISLAWIMRKLGDWTMPFATVIMAAGYLLISLATSYPLLLIGSMVVGLGGGFALPPISLYLPRIVTPRQRTLGVAVIMSVAQLGQFLSPLYTDLFVSGVSDEACRLRFVVSAVTTVVIGFLVWGFTRTLPKAPLKD